MTAARGYSTAPVAATSKALELIHFHLILIKTAGSRPVPTAP